MDMKLVVQMPRRRGTVDVSPYMAKHNKIDVGIYTCHALGLFQVNDGDDAQPYFICELNSGQNIYADPERVWFTDTNENGNIVDEEE